MKNYIAPIVAPNTEANDNDIPDVDNVIRDDPENVNLLDVSNDLASNDEMPMGESAVNNVVSGEDDDMELNKLLFTRLSDHEYIEQIGSLNTEQHQAFDICSSYFSDLQKFQSGESLTRPKPIHLFISGPGGTGKSHLIKLIKELAIRSSLNSLTKDSPAVVVMAPTGVAAFNIEGTTIHRALTLPVQHHTCRKSLTYIPLKGERLATMRRQWRHTNTIIIDEISMVSYETFGQINRRLNDIKAVSEDCFFGNLNVITLGDFYQLPPVAPGHFIFKGESGRIHLWRDLFSMIELNKNMRQRDDSQFADMLLRIRTASQTEDDIKLLQTRIVDDGHFNPNLEHSNSTLHLYPLIKSCDTYNNFQLQSLASVSVTYHIRSIHALVEVKNGRSIYRKDIPDNLIPDDDRECAGLVKELRLCIGAVVMLCRNINTSDGLVNGARGIVTNLVWKDGISPRDPRNSCMPERVYVNFFDHNVGKLNNLQTNTDSIAIEPVTAEFYGKGKLGTSILRTQLPLRLSWAATIHKVQGVTLSNAFVDIGPDVFAPGMAYVALSRVKTLTGMTLLAFDRMAINCSTVVEEEMIRLRQKLRSSYPSGFDFEAHEEC